MIFKRTAPALVMLLALGSSSRADFIFPNFSSTAGLHLLDQATQVGTVLRLTSAAVTSPDRGAAYFATPQDVVHGFTTTFQYQITAPQNGGGQGFAFVMQASNDFGINDIGDGGPRLGYNRINNNLAVEFDTRQQAELHDPSANHISVNAGIGVDPNNADHVPYEVGHVDPAFKLDDGNVHRVRIDYLPQHLLTIGVDGSTLLSVGVDLANFNLFNGTSAFVGFTSGVDTSGSANHDILSWSFGTPAAVPEPSTFVLAGTGVLAFLGYAFLGYAWRRRRAAA